MCNTVSDLKKATCLKIPRGKQMLLTGGNSSIILSFLFLTVLWDDLQFSQWNKTTFSLISVETGERPCFPAGALKPSSAGASVPTVIISVLPMSLAYRSTFGMRHEDWCRAKPVGDAVVGTFHRHKSEGFVWPTAMQSQFTASLRDFCWSTKLLF